MYQTVIFSLLLKHKIPVENSNSINKHSEQWTKIMEFPNVYMTTCWWHFASSWKRKEGIIALRSWFEKALVLINFLFQTFLSHLLIFSLVFIKVLPGWFACLIGHLDLTVLVFVQSHSKVTQSHSETPETRVFLGKKKHWKTRASRLAFLLLSHKESSFFHPKNIHRKSFWTLVLPIYARVWCMHQNKQTPFLINLGAHCF